MSNSDRTQLLSQLGLKEYEVEALDGLLRLGRTSAPELSESTGIPKARIYDVLDGLANLGYVKVIPGRPKQYEARPPEEILRRADQNRFQEYEQYSQRLDEMEAQFRETFEPLYEAAEEGRTPSDELFYVVDVGEPSLRETRRLYEDAEDCIDVVTQAFEYFPDVEPTFETAVDRGIDVRILFLHPRHLTPENREIQRSIVGRIGDEYPDVECRFSEKPLPLRCTVADPSMDYESGRALFLVEEKDVPPVLQQSAITENGSLVAGMERYVDLIWQYESAAEYPDA